MAYFNFSEMQCDESNYGCRFPNRNHNWKEKWIEVVRVSRNEPLWHPTSRSVICSSHFESDDLYYTIKGLRRVKQNANPKILPGVPEQLYDEDLSSQSPTIVQDAVPDLPFSDLNKPTTSQTVQVVVPDLPFSDSIQPSTSHTVQDAVPDLPFSDLNQPNTSHTVQVVVQDPPFSDLNQPSTSYPVIPVQSVQDPSIFDTPRKFKLREKVLVLETKLKRSKIKIKTLEQKVRRLTNRNKSLKEILANLKKRNYIDSDLFNIADVDIFNNLNKKKFKKNIKYTRAIKNFCLTLNHHSPKAYEYVRATFNTCLPHPKTLAKWYGHIKGELGLTEESEASEHEPICNLVFDEMGNMGIHSQKL